MARQHTPAPTRPIDSDATRDKVRREDDEILRQP